MRERLKKPDLDFASLIQARVSPCEDGGALRSAEIAETLSPRRRAMIANVVGRAVAEMTEAAHAIPVGLAVGARRRPAMIANNRHGRDDRVVA
jgi:hypothetical protein